MKIRVGLKGAGGTSLAHSRVSVSSRSGLELAVGGQRFKCAALTLTNKNGGIALPKAVPGLPSDLGSEVTITSRSPLSINLAGGATGTYDGTLVLAPAKSDNHTLTAALELDLEIYVQGVLRSEVPASYQMQAMKAQAILARTYALRPRLDHTPDGVNVCDSYLCCQAFNGVDPGLTAGQRQAINESKGVILSFEGKPALALFSACAGGHTDSYSNCFSDPVTDQFPAPGIPYLVPVPEGKLPAGFPDEHALEQLWHDPHPATIDGTASQFKWQVRLTGDQIEAHMHHVLDTMATERQFKPFIKNESGARFGQVKKFSVSKRGPSGVAMQLDIDTSTGVWSIEKELAIRSAFANPDIKLKRLRSGRIFFKHEYDKLGLLQAVSIFGLGSGHGVGLQQVGAQALALSGLSAEKILARYYPGTRLIKV